MTTFFTCRCGEVLDDKSPHTCPGTPTERIAALESEVARLDVVLLSVAPLPADERNALVAEWLGE